MAFLVVDSVSKRFGQTQALDDVSVSFERGEVHALMGENGAGKSTLGKAIAGLHRPDEGTITLEGAELRTGSIDDAFEAGVRIVHQELAQCPNLSVAENLCLHALPRRLLGMLDRATMNERARSLLQRLDPDIDVEVPLGMLPPGRRQICQIASALDDARSTPRVIVFDEPTSSLSLTETERLLQITRQLADDGITVIYVSHRMAEIFAACDRVSVLRDGRYVATSNIADITESDLVEQMIGRRIDGGEAGAIRAMSGSEHASIGQVRLSVRDLSSKRGRLEDVTFEVRAGEILGVGGLVGAGRSELLDAIWGVDRQARGSIEVNGHPMPVGRPRAMIAAGVGYVPEDRRHQGLFFQMDLRENITLPFMRRFARAGIRSPHAEQAFVDDRMRDFQVKAAGQEALPGSLSGGNQQKLLIARWMSEGTSVLLLDEPTRGIDVGTKAEIYRHIRHAAARGAAILFVSSEMPELLALADRIIVLRDGRVAGEVEGDHATQGGVLQLATGASA